MNKTDNIFKEIFDKSPIGILFYDKKGNLIDANRTALEIAGIDSIDNFKNVNLFDNPDIASRKEELLKNGLIKFQSQLNYDNIKNKGFYDSTKSGIAFIDWTVSATDSNFLVQIQDITEHERAEKELKKEHELLNTIIDTIPVMISVYDPEIKVLKINKEIEKVTGWTQEDIYHISLMKKLYPDPDYRREVEEYMQSLTPGWKELIMNAKDGSKIDSLWANVNINDGRNVGIGLDIRERKKAEKELKRRAALLDISYEAIFSWKYDGNILSWNQGAERLYGYSKKQAIGKVSHDLLKTKFPVEFNEIMKKLANEKTWAGELIHTAKDGRELIVESLMQLIQDSSGKKVVIETNRDITKRKKIEEKNKGLINELMKFTEELEVSNEELQATTEELYTANEELKQSQKLLQDVINGYPSIIFVKDLEGRFIIINNKLEELLGASNEEVMGKTDYDIFSKEEAEYYRAHDRKVLKEGRAIPIEEEADLEDGHHTFLANKFPIYDINGEPYGVGSISTDITEIKRLQNELIQSRENLEEQVEERTSELEDAYQILKEKEMKYRSLYENAPVGIFHSTLNGKYIDVNPELARLLGYDSPEDLISTANKTSIADVIYVNKNLRPGFLESALKADAWFKTENLYRRKDGEVIIGDLSFRDFGKDKDGNLLLEGFMTDITARKRSDERLREIITELERSNKE
ncbi:PAS domain S-box protein [Methanobacterium sp.]|uniref:PAS domain S-box protein n=1 Tax=Methanobacterium sp. TaxID=2164 RepID=UPI003C78F6AD